jgi:hypothetical protein
MTTKRIKKNDINGWKEEEEDILKVWADKATCYNWLHSNSHEKYYKINAYFTIPVIVISTLTGTANFAIERFGEDVKSVASMVIGGFNIIAAIISTVAQFLRISEINEGHRVASIAWDKFARNVKIELAKNPVDRRPANELIKIYKEEYDRLIETSPMIKKDVISRFNDVFKNNGIIRPEITGLIKETTVFDRKKIEWEIVEEPKAMIIDMTEEIEKFKRNYFETNGRFPNITEIKAHFPNYDISENINEHRMINVIDDIKINMDK